MSWKENWKRWIEDWKNFIILIILALVVLYLGVRTFPNNPQMVVAVLGLFFTLIGIVFYGTAVPTISPRIKTGVVRVTKDNPPNLFIDTRVIITNVSRFPARAYVNLNLEFNGKPIPTPDSYDGRRPWNLYPREGINGHFETTLEKEKIKVNSKLTMTIKIRNAGFSRYIIKYPTGHWHFDFQKNEWYNEDFGYYALKMNEIRYLLKCFFEAIISFLIIASYFNIGITINWINLLLISMLFFLYFIRVRGNHLPLNATLPFSYQPIDSTAVQKFL